MRDKKEGGVYAKGRPITEKSLRADPAKRLLCHWAGFFTLQGLAPRGPSDAGRENNFFRPGAYRSDIRSQHQADMFRRSQRLATYRRSSLEAGIRFALLYL